MTSGEQKPSTTRPMAELSEVFDRDSKGRILCEMCLVANGENKLAKWKTHLKNEKDGSEEYIVSCEDHREDLEDHSDIEVMSEWQINRGDGDD